jgi:hypothetical protein
MAKTVTITDLKLLTVSVQMALGHDTEMDGLKCPGDENISAVTYQLLDGDGAVVKDCISWQPMSSLSADSKKVVDDFVAVQLANMKRIEDL